MHLTRKLVFLAVLLLAIFIPSTWAAGNRTVTVMTKNMDTGTDLGFLFANLQNPQVGVQLTWAEIQKNDYVERARLLAEEIAAAKPDLVGLQEVTLLRAGPTTATATNVTMDQLQLLIGSLAALGESYSVVTKQALTDLAFQVSDTLAVRLTDQDAIIIRNDLPDASIRNIQGNFFATLLSFGGITSYRGWISADITTGADTFRFVTTHLESPGSFYGKPAIDEIQVAQAAELAAFAVASPIPVVIAGDFNSNSAHTPAERTLSYQVVINSGFTDAWTTANHGNPGFTWPLYLEDPLRAHTKGPLERIDYVLERGFSVESADRTGVKEPQSSDHAGVVATLSFPSGK